MSKIRTIRVTLDIDLASLPREDWEEDIAETTDDPEEVSDDWPLEELSTYEVAACVEQATYDPHMFAGSMLFLMVAGTRVVSHGFVDEGPAHTPAK